MAIKSVVCSRLIKPDLGAAKLDQRSWLWGIIVHALLRKHSTHQLDSSPKRPYVIHCGLWTIVLIR